MENNLISIKDVCAHHQVEINFIQSLEDFGLIQTKIVKKTTFLDTDELSKLERYLRLSQDLEINLEGLHAVSHLLNQLQEVQKELNSLKNELNYYKQLH
ncbi:MerR family transcriptional regulator [Pedobacter frigidisoli]|uniref:MerR family transcriptional regulator n=1 Tax=Pedobacter frigidisoli TaxID=2530455 RepID=A0A4R0P0F5_9SPHI|nr:chaperone modulator CbpM [Pedobacter frigidisoli]TCD10175.1 MerR family transcriptional regulator [Pedobacter frigidisoli]